MQSFSTAADIKAQRRIKQHTISFQPASALQLKRVLDRRAEVYLYMARAQYLAGEMIPARVSLSKGLQLQPQHPLLWYNLALVQEEFAIKVLATDKDRRSLADVQRAIDELEQATATFARLSGFVDKSKRDRRARPPAEDPEIKGNVPLEMDLDARARRALETPTPGYISQRARKHHEFCVSAVEQAQPHLNYAQVCPLFYFSFFFFFSVLPSTLPLFPSVSRQAQEQRKRQLHEQGVRQQELWRREQEEKKERERQEREAEEARQREVLKELAEISHRIAQRQAELEVLSCFAFHSPPHVIVRTSCMKFVVCVCVSGDPRMMTRRKARTWQTEALMPTNRTRIGDLLEVGSERNQKPPSRMT